MYLVKKDIQPSVTSSANEDEPTSAADRGHCVKDASVPFVVPFWHVQCVYEAKHKGINMVMRREATSVPMGDGSNHKVKVPHLINTKTIAEGTMLLYLSEVPKGGSQTSGFVHPQVAGKAAAAAKAKSAAKAKGTMPPAKKTKRG